MADDNLELKTTPTEEKIETVHKRNSFVFYRDWYDIICQLDDKTAIDLCKAIMASAFEENYDIKLAITRTLMLAINPQIKRDVEKWNEVRVKRSEAGKKHRGNQYSTMEQNGTNETSVIKMEQNGTNGTVNVDVDVDVSKDMLDNKEDTSVSKKEKPLWKTSYEEYRRLFIDAKQELLVDNEFKTKQESYYPNIDYEKSIEKGMDYWLDEETWKKVSREKLQTIKPKERLKKNFDKNRIYKPKGEQEEQKKEMSFIERHTKYVQWLGEQVKDPYAIMPILHVTLDDFIEMFNSCGGDSVKLANATMSLLSGKMNKGESLISAFRRNQV